MTGDEFFRELDTRIAKYDLRCHPFDKAGSAGRLTRDDLRNNAQDYHITFGRFLRTWPRLDSVWEDGA